MTEKQQWKQYGELRSFGRRKGKRLSARQQHLWDNLLPQLRVDVDALPQGELHLEIGFGAGEHLVAQARTNPHIFYIGAEPFNNGVAHCLVDIAQHNIENICIFPDDVHDLLDALPDGSIAHTDILFPDPWRKKAHYKRRLVNPITLAKLARVMRADASLLLATDHEDYGAWMLEQIALSPDFYWTAQCKDDFLTQPDRWVRTRYQAKAQQEGREEVLFVRCRRV